MQYAVHLTVRIKDCSGIQGEEEQIWTAIKLAKEKEIGREKPHMQLNPSQSILCCQFFWPTLLWTRTGTQDSMNWPSGLQIRTFVL